MKRTLFVMFALVLIGSLAFAQNEVDLKQTGATNTATIDQSGRNSTVDIEQIGVSADPETGLVNQAWAYQRGSGVLIDVYQNAGTYNYAELSQTATNNAEIKANQVAMLGYNYLKVLQRYMNNNYIDIKQEAGTYNHADLRHGYTSNEMQIYQNAYDYNWAEVKAHQAAVNQYLYGADADGNIVTGTPATQISYNSYNYLKVSQRQADYIGLHQEASGFNYADISQNHTNSLGAYQVSADGNNELITNQPSGIANLVQDAFGDNYANVDQRNGAVLAGADSDGAINTDKAATQISSGSYNELWTEQSGSGNQIGLYQFAGGYNFADIEQFNGNNKLGIYQTNADGYNRVEATQEGNSTATVIQNTTSGNGYITVNQGL